MGHHTLVVGASSRNGRAALRHLTGQGEGGLRATTRDPRKITEPGVYPVAFDWTDPSTWDAAVADIDRMYLIVPETSPEAALAVRQFLGRAVAAGTRRVVSLSARGVDEFPEHPLHMVDAAVADMCPEWAILRPNWFMQNFSTGIFHPSLVEEGVIRAPGGSALISFVHIDDVGAVAATLLGDRAGPAWRNRAYELTGAQALTFAQAAAKIAAATGRPIRYEEVDIDDVELSAKVGAPQIDRRMVAALFGRVVTGGEAGISDDVRRLLGREPITFDAFAAASAQVWAAAPDRGTEG